MPKARSRVIKPASKVKEDKPSAPRTIEQLDEEERTERKPRGYSNDPWALNPIVGVTFCHVNHDGGWFYNGQRIIVQRWYIGKRLVIDWGISRKDLEARKRFFATTDVAYTFIAPGEKLDEKEMRTRIQEALDERDNRQHS